MLHKKSGHIINMCSIASLDAYPNGSSYCISKFALYGFSKCLREELKTSGIRVTSILPGAAWSDSWKGAELPVDRLMQSNDVAKAVLCAIELSPAAVLEEIILRPQLGDL
jgi:short-subunit dehydrogenase